MNIPLERDEGEFAYVGQLMLDGVAPYKLAYVIKLPGTSAIYALSMALFGQTIAGIHLGLLFANALAIVFVFLLAKKWFGPGVGLIAGGIYALMSLSWSVDGHAAHATQFVATAALGGILLLERGLESRRVAALFGSGLLFGIAFLLKQPGILFGVFGGFLLLRHEFKSPPPQWSSAIAKAAVYCAGIILPFALLCLWMWREGVFDRFWYWAFTVAGARWSSPNTAGQLLMGHFHWLIKTHQWPFWLLALLALPFAWWMEAARRFRVPFLIFCGVSILAGCVGLTFIPHYFVLTLPAFGMLIGLGTMELRRRMQKSNSLAGLSATPVILIGIVCVGVIFADRNFLFDGAPDELSVQIYGRNLFLESLPVGEYIKNNSAPDALIAVLGSEPEIYFYSHRHSATGHVSTYLLTEGRSYSESMQRQMIDQIEAARPEYIVFVNSTLSWSSFIDQTEGPMVETMLRFIKENYTLTGLAIVNSTLTNPVYYWDADAPTHAEDEGARVFVYRLAGSGSGRLNKS